MGAYALDVTATFPPQSAVRCFQNDGQRATGFWGSCSFYGRPVGSSLVSEKLPEEGLKSELQKDGISWRARSRNRRRETVLGVGKCARWGAGELGFGAGLLLAVWLVVGKLLFLSKASVS